MVLDDIGDGCKKRMHCSKSAGNAALVMIMIMKKDQFVLHEREDFICMNKCKW